MLTQDKLGITPCTISTLNGPQCNSGEKDKNQTSSSGLDSSNSVRDLLQDSSTMRSPIQLGSDTMVISITLRKFFILSLTEIKINKLSLAWTPPPRKEELLSRPNGTPLVRWHQRSSRRKRCSTHTRWASGFLKSLISKEFGNSIETTLLSLKLLKLLVLAN